MKQKVTIEVEFEENYCVTKPIKEYSRQEVVKAWRYVIMDALQARLKACKTSLFENRNRVIGVTEYAIQYLTENNILKHYSIPAAKSMEETIANFKNGDYSLNTMNLVQILKALYWVSDSTRTQRIEGVSFDDLYSYLLLSMGDETIPVFHL